MNLNSESHFHQSSEDGDFNAESKNIDPDEQALESEKVVRINLLKKKIVGRIGKEKREERSAKSYIVEMENGARAIFKPGSEEIDLRPEIQPGTHYKRECASYLVNKFLHFDIVPPTVTREIDDKIGSLQKFIPDARDAWELYKENKDEFNRQYGNTLLLIYIFDYMTWNSDRSGDNIICKEGKCYAVDNGISFANINTSYVNRFYDSPIPQEIIRTLIKNSSDQKEVDELKMQLTELLGEDEAQACIARIKYLAGILNSKDTLQKSDPLPFNPK